MSGSKSSDASFARAASQAPESAPADHPLGLTVHNVPRVQDALRESQRTRLGRWKMIGVLLVCAAPVIASYFTYYVLRPEGRRNWGELIAAQPTLPTWSGTTLDGRSLPLSRLQGQWLLVSVGGGACGAPCQERLYLQRQLRESLGKDKDRLDWVWLVSDDAQPPADIAPGLAQATVLRVDPQALAQWLAPAPGHTLDEHLYVVDPMGHWMMRFPAPLSRAEAPKAKRDLERLLRASASWDQAGRAAQP